MTIHWERDKMVEEKGKGRKAARKRQFRKKEWEEKGVSKNSEGATLRSSKENSPRLIFCIKEFMYLQLKY